MMNHNIYISITKYLSPCDILSLGLTNKYYYRLTTKYNKVRLHNCYKPYLNNQHRASVGCYRFMLVKDPANLFEEAAKNGHIHLAKHILIKYGDVFSVQFSTNIIMRDALCNGHLHICKWIHSDFNSCLNLKSIEPLSCVLDAIKKNRVIIAEWLIKTLLKEYHNTETNNENLYRCFNQFYPGFKFKNVLRMFAANGNCEMFMRFVEINKPFTPCLQKNCLRHAAKNGRINIFKIIIEKFKPHMRDELKQMLFRFAVKYGHLNFCKWYITQYKSVNLKDPKLRKCSGSAKSISAEHKKVIKWIDEIIVL